MWNEYFNVNNLEDALTILDEKGSEARIISGGTDLILELERGVRKGVSTLIDVSRLGCDSNCITLDDQDNIHLGMMVTHNQCVGSKLIRERAYPLARACWEVGSPQIRNRGTIAGNIITASPANDTISPLMALGATVVLISKQGGEREVPINQFYTGVRKNVMSPQEMLVDIYFPAMSNSQRGAFIKYALRRAQAISVVNVSVILDINENMIRDAQIAMGSVTPIVCLASEGANHLIGKSIDDDEAFEKAAELVMLAANPISDIRSSQEYRNNILKVVTKRAIHQSIKQFNDLPDEPVLLSSLREKSQSLAESSKHDQGVTIKTSINGKTYEVKGGQQKTLLRFLREDVGLIGTKEGCAEGECGACTVHLDGKAVMACMVPAPRAHGAEITTIEGVGSEEELHPVQAAFIQEGAVQCGYCTPGFIMSAVKLLEEYPNPSHEQVKQSITGNLCRCTGYYKIIKAIEEAATLMEIDR
ncbi:MAG: FAD binding domain-containing protein [Anaerolineae bacterium]|nr:FAD binding domain-containing protein [Anaerolineae bacterium]